MIDESGAPGGAANGEALPDDIAFLEAFGIGRPLLEEAARLGRVEGVAASDALLGHGFVSAETFYRALARTIGAPFVAAPGPLEPRAQTVATGARARLVDGRTPATCGGRPVRPIAPRGLAIARVLACGPAPAEIVVTTPQALQAAHIAANAEDVAREAAEGTTMGTCDLSAKGGLTAGQLIALALVAAAFGALVLVADSPLVLLGALIGPIFLVYVGLKLVACLLSRAQATSHRPPRLPDRALPIYTILVPLNREAASVPRLCRALRALDYPALGSKCTKAPSVAITVFPPTVPAL